MYAQYLHHIHSPIPFSTTTISASMFETVGGNKGKEGEKEVKTSVHIFKKEKEISTCI
jgi:hypothetical protein